MSRSRITKLSLPRFTNRVGVLKLEYAKVVQDNFQIVALREDGRIIVPTATICALLLGPGTSITHDASLLLYQAGVCVIWVSGGGVNGYAVGSPLGNRADLFQKHVSTWANNDLRLAAAKRAYKIRFNDDLNYITSFDGIRQLEGSRVKAAYRDYSLKYGINWNKRIVDWDSADELNKCITISYQYLYGFAFSAISLMGCSPSLGFIHNGHRLAFVYDIADLLKTNLGLDVAFQAFSMGGHEHVGHIINNMMNRAKGNALLVDSIFHILGVDTVNLDDVSLVPDLTLWSGNGDGDVVAGVDYSGD